MSRIGLIASFGLRPQSSRRPQSRPSRRDAAHRSSGRGQVYAAPENFGLRSRIGADQSEPEPKRPPDGRLGENCYNRAMATNDSLSAKTLAGPKASPPAVRPIAGGETWSISEIVCSAGPGDRVYEERHQGFSISAVLQGCFTYRSDQGKSLLYPGALLLGANRSCYECGHEPARGIAAFRLTCERTLSRTSPRSRPRAETIRSAARCFRRRTGSRLSSRRSSACRIAFRRSRRKSS
jgi:hypothetical protein